MGMWIFMDNVYPINFGMTHNAEISRSVAIGCIDVVGQESKKMWIRNKRTGEYKCVSPAEGKHTIHHQPKIWKDTQSKYCKSCGAENHREKMNCRICGQKM